MAWFSLLVQQVIEKLIVTNIGKSGLFSYQLTGQQWFKTGKHAALDGASAVDHQQVGIALWCQLIVTDCPEAVRHIGLKMVTYSNGIGRSRANSKDAFSLHLIQAAVETYLYTKRLGLFEQSAVECTGAWSALYQIKEHPITFDLMALAAGIKKSAIMGGHGIKAGCKSLPLQYAQNILFGRPVFQALKITAKAVANLLVCFVYYHLASCMCQGDCCGQARRAGAGDLDSCLGAGVFLSSVMYGTPLISQLFFMADGAERIHFCIIVVE